MSSDNLVKADKKKNVVVVGGGAAGMVRYISPGILKPLY